MVAAHRVDQLRRKLKDIRWTSGQEIPRRIKITARILPPAVQKTSSVQTFAPRLLF